ncbi:hypothetical protein PMI01_02598 [Caulobacter sp. AP07]|uniref:hypothetical protein n=1 Tax=Caulobacter sp. AP07 TaxID=1144304 RepID=UPI0002720194|nr:hypothetical protein [Caulobacter sp. AP07]EJL32218.1 hypothetical protein PMI01_02598 [Caulobacter sp. AP07]
MLANLFKPKEVKATLQALEELKPSFTTPDPFAHIAVKLVFGEARQMTIQQSADTVGSIRDQNWKPRDLALLLISKRAFAHAASGTHHVYRGTPDQTGHAIKAIFTKAGKLMVASGFIQPSEQHADQVALEKEMKEVG